MIIFTILQAVLVLAAFAYTTKRIKNCDPVSWKVRKGMKCYSCRAPLCGAEEMSRRLFSEAEDFRLCNCCEREEKLSSTLGMNKSVYMNRLKKFCHSEKSHRSTIYLAVALFLCLVASFFLKGLTKTEIFVPLSFFINLAYWVFFAYRSKIAFEDKEESK